MPLEIDYAAEVTPPPGTPPEMIDQLIRTGRFCGTRMQYAVSEPSTYFDKVGHRVAPRLLLADVEATSTPGKWLSAKQATLDNGVLRYQVDGLTGGVSACDVPAAFYTAVYALAKRDAGSLVSQCRLRISTPAAAPQ